MSDRWGDHALSCGCGGDKILRHNAVRDVVCSAVSEFTSVSPELEKPGLLLPPRPPSDPTPAFVSRLAPRLLLLLVVVLLMSGFPWVCPVSLRLGTSRSRPCSALLISPRLPRRLLIFFMRAPPLRWPSVGPPLSRFFWRLAGETEGGEAGPRLFGQSCLGLPLRAFLVIYLETSASGLPSASVAPFTGKTRAQSLDALPGQLAAARVWWVIWFLRLVGDFLVPSLVFLSCRCAPFSFRSCLRLSCWVCVCVFRLFLVVPSLALVRFERYSTLSMCSVAMCLRPSLLAWC